MFYEQEERYKTLEEFKGINRRLYYYNNKRIKEKGLTPASFRNQSLLVS